MSLMRTLRDGTRNVRGGLNARQSSGYTPFFSFSLELSTSIHSSKTFAISGCETITVMFSYANSCSKS